jgi:hypothetical protein
MNAELVEFTRRALEKGIARTDVSRVLQQAGWAEAEIAAASGAFAVVDFPLPVPRPKPYLSAREVFVYLIQFASLYASAFYLGDLIFEFINRAFTDAVASSAFGRYSGDRIRWDVAALLVAFPLFVYMFRFIAKMVAQDPTKRASRPRKWLTYLTLFVAAVALTGDLVTLVYNVLGGEYTIRFLLKVATVAIIAGGTFSYFLADMRKEEQA